MFTNFQEEIDKKELECAMSEVQGPMSEVGRKQ